MAAAAPDRERPGSGSWLEWGIVAGLAAVGGAALLATARLSMQTAFGPGPAFAPRLLAAALLALAAVRGAALLIGRSGSGPAPVAVEAAEDPAGPGGYLRFAIVSVSLLAYPALLGLVGYVIATALLSWVGLAAFGRRPVRALIESVVAAFLLRWAFSSLLEVPLPVASLPFLRF